MDHKQAERLMQKRADGSILPRELSALKAHLKNCPRCAQTEEEQRRLDHLLRQMAPVEMPPNLSQMVARSLDKAPMKVKTPFPVRALALSACAVCLLMAGTVGGLMGGAQKLAEAPLLSRNFEAATRFDGAWASEDAAMEECVEEEAAPEACKSEVLMQDSVKSEVEAPAEPAVSSPLSEDMADGADDISPTEGAESPNAPPEEPAPEPLQEAPEAEPETYTVTFREENVAEYGAGGVEDSTVSAENRSIGLRSLCRRLWPVAAIAAACLCAGGAVWSLLRRKN